MNEISARDVLLVRAFETSIGEARWTDADRAWANQAALDNPSNNGTPSAADFIARRAALGASRLGERDPEISQLRHALTWRSWVGPLIVGIAFGLGLLTDAIGPEKKINLLAPPLLGILLWNLLVYGFMLAAGSWRSLRPGLASTSAQPQPGFNGPIGRLVAWLAGGPGRQANVGGHGTADSQSTLATSSPAAEFTRTWLASSAPLTTARTAAILHFAAAAFAAGALAAMYFRGLGLEYLAGWESTFLNADNVTSVLTALFAPASWLSGIAVPDAAGFAAMQFRSGQGVNAAPWIHLYAITLLIFVIVPRLALAFTSSLKATRLRDRFAVDTDSPYFESLARILRGDEAQLLIIPYSYRPEPAVCDSLNRLLGRVHGADASITLSPPVTQGSEDTWQLPATTPPAAITVALFAMTATPEHETHGAFAKQLGAQIPTTTVLLPIIDESAFRQRFGQQSGRLEQRRIAWRKVLGAAGVMPVFVDLQSAVPATTEQLVLDVINAGHGQTPTRAGPLSAAPDQVSTGNAP